MTGAARYAADNYPDGALFAITVGAPVAAGRVTGIDIAPARAVRGVLASSRPRHAEAPQDRDAGGVRISRGRWIRWEGQPVAIVLAESVEAAERGRCRDRRQRAATTALPARAGSSPPSANVKEANTKGNVDTDCESATKSA